MTNEPRAMDRLALRFLADAAPEDRPRLAAVFGEADVIGRHLPMHSTPGRRRACWLTFTAMEAAAKGDPWAHVLRDAAQAAVIEAAGAMEVLVARTPDDPRTLTDGA